MDDVASIAASISAIAAAAAAIASWRAIRLSRQPRLDLSITHRQPSEEIWVTLTNGGLGPARRVYVALVLGNELFTISGGELSSYLAHDESITVRPKFHGKPAGEDAFKGFVGCYDVFGLPRTWDLEDHRRRGWRITFQRFWIRRVPAGEDEFDVLGKYYGEEFAAKVREMPRVGFERHPSAPS